MKNTRIALAFAGATLIAACGSDKKDPTGPGGEVETSYQANFSGGVARTISGQAAFASDNTDEDIGFALALVDTKNASADDMILFYRANAGVPANGAITIADYLNTPDDEIPGSQLVATAMLDLDAADPIFCTATGGKLTVTSSASARLKGTFTMTMTCARIQSEEEFETTVTGSFDAVGGNVVIPG